MAIANVTVVPLGTGGPSLSSYVREVIKIAENSPGVKVVVGPNATAVEGELDAVIAAVRAMHEAPFNQGVKRVLTLVSIDDRRDRPLTIDGKLAAVGR